LVGEAQPLTFSFSSVQEYTQAANDLFNDSEAIHFIRRSPIAHFDGDILFYKGSTNEFGILSNDGFIRTYYPPKQGSLYFLKLLRQGG